MNSSLGASVPNSLENVEATKTRFDLSDPIIIEKQSLDCRLNILRPGHFSISQSNCPNALPRHRPIPPAAVRNQPR